MKSHSPSSGGCNSTQTRLRAALCCAVCAIVWSANATAQPTANRQTAVVVDGARPDIRDAYGISLATVPDSVPPSYVHGVSIVAPRTVMLHSPTDDHPPSTDSAPRSELLRSGVVRDLTITLADGRWFDVPGGGSLWTVDIRASDAGYARLHLTNVDMPPNAVLVVYAPSDPLPMGAPYRGRGIHDNGRFWTPTLFSSHVRVEYYTPARRNPEMDEHAPFVIDRLLHLDSERIDAALSLETGSRSSCSSDVTCWPEWADVSRAVARILFIEDGVGYACTGQLLNSEARDWTPYVLTGNRCIRTEEAARSAEFYWLYQTSVCDAEPPEPADVPRSSVATLLATGVESDYTLLMVEGALPGGLYWVGWTTAPMPDDTMSSTVHHPAGNAKGISFGKTSSSTVTHVDITWQDGGTQVGSDGAGVFDAATHRLFAQLSRSGGMDCSETDDAGAFSRTYPYIAAMLAGGDDDDLEESDTCEAARSVCPSCGGTFYPDLVVRRVDEDWYGLFVPTGTRLLVELQFTHDFGDIDATLYGNCGGAPLVSAHSRTDNETLSFVNEGPDASLRLNVRLFSDMRNQYDMRLSLTPANDDCEDAWPIVNESVAGQLVGATADGESSCGKTAELPDVWYRHTATCTGILHIDTCGTHDTGGEDAGIDTMLSVYPGCPGTLDREIACNDDWPLGTVHDACVRTDGGELHDSALAIPVTVGETFLICVARSDGGTTGGLATLNVACRLIHDDCIDAVPLVEGESYSGSTEGAVGVDVTTCTLDDRYDVWHRWTAPCDMKVDISLCDSEYDTSLAVFDGCGGVELACIDDNYPDCGFGGQSQISGFEAIENETYFIRVAGYGGSTGLYSALITPSNDTCIEAEPVTEGAYSFCTRGAETDGPDEGEQCPFADSTQVNRDVWHCYTASDTGYTTVNLCNSDYDNRVVVYEGCDCPMSASAMACDDDGCPRTTGALAAFATRAGEDYLIRVGGARDQSGSGTMIIQHGECVTDGDCDDGIFCNGAEQCIGQVCRPGRDPCLRSWCLDDACRLYGNGDFDRDGDVDMSDLARFLACFEHFAIPDCETANLAGDGWITLEDYAMFQDLLAGP